MRFVTELAKMRAFVELWDEITRDRFGVQDPAKRRFRYGVQVNSLGLTEQQPENNAYRILIEMLSVVLSRGSARPRRATAGLERGARPAAALRPAMVAASAADHGLRDRPARIRRHFRRQQGGRRARRDAEDAKRWRKSPRSTRWAARSGRSRSGALKARLVESNTRRLEAIERGEQIVVGVNAFTNSEPSPLTAGENSILVPSAEAEAEQVAAARRRGGRAATTRACARRCGRCARPRRAA